MKSEDPYVVVRKKDYQMLVNSSTYNQRAIREVKIVPASYVYASGYVQAEIEAENGKVTQNPYEDVFIPTFGEINEDMSIKTPTVKDNTLFAIVCVLSFGLGEFIGAVFHNFLFK